MVDLKKLVTFIARVVNATVEVKSKTGRMQIIIKALSSSQPDDMGGGGE